MRITLTEEIHEVLSLSAVDLQPLLHVQLMLVYN